MPESNESVFSYFIFIYKKKSVRLFKIVVCCQLLIKINPNVVWVCHSIVLSNGIVACFKW